MEELSAVGARPGCFFSADFVNITPWYGGRHTQDAVRCLDERCTKAYYSLPTARSVKGLLRWLTRAVVASFVPDDQLASHGYAAVECFPNCGSSKPGLVEAIFGTVEHARPGGQRVGSRAGALSVVVKPKLNCRSPVYAEYQDVLKLIKSIAGGKGWGVYSQKPSALLQELEDRGFRALRGEARPEDKAAGFAELFTVPRVLLNAQRLGKLRGKRQEEFARSLFEVQPLREGCVSMRVELYLDGDMLSGALEPARGEELAESVKRLEELLLVYGLLLFGIGKASSRGFGRFAPKSPRGNVHPLVEKAAARLEERDLEGFREECLGLAERALRALGVEAEARRTVASVPRISNAEVTLIERPAHPYPYASREAARVKPSKKPCSGDVLCVLSAVGKATLKSTWKAYWQSISGAEWGVTGPGFPFHTWGLGLPRAVCKGNSCTGYVVVDAESLGGAQGDVDYCLQRLSFRNDLKRWKSPLVLSPVPAGNGLGVAVVLLKRLDIKPFLSPEARRAVLAHVGIHQGSRYLHVIDVGRGASTTGWTEDCGSDPLGAADVSQRRVVALPGDAAELLVKVQELARDWVVYLLR
ncbi:RAMP superfamily CRISPR-associated protein [Thermofilum pendens]|uniref:RAMP superfamily CRISPR-associated protein n=1 Tax=Thermofilum pendens TaxID=2269 RepID=UPI00069C5B61